MRLAVIIPAAGASSRYVDALGTQRAKLDEDLGGRPVLQRTVELFGQVPEVAAIVVAGPHDPAALAEFKLRHGDRLGLLGVTLCAGGKTHRYETVHAALRHVPADCTHVAVHDAARPCTPGELIERVIRAAHRHHAVIPAIPVTETLKRTALRDAPPDQGDRIDDILGIAPKDATLRAVDATIDREGVYQAQTPQLFERGLLERAYQQPDLASTDDAQLVERLGEPVVVVEGDARNIKITRPADLVLARAILGLPPPAARPVHKRF